MVVVVIKIGEVVVNEIIFHLLKIVNFVDVNPIIVFVVEQIEIVQTVSEVLVYLKVIIELVIVIVLVSRIVIDYTNNFEN